MQMTDTTRITLRMPEHIHDWLRQQSFETRESINALIVKALEEKMNQPEAAKEIEMNENTQFVHIEKSNAHGKTTEDAYIVGGEKVSYTKWCAATAQAEATFGLAWAKRLNVIHRNIGPTDRIETEVSKYL